MHITFDYLFGSMSLNWHYYGAWRWSWQCVAFKCALCVHVFSTFNCSHPFQIFLKKNLTWFLPGYCFFFETERPGHQEDLTFEAEVEVEGAAVSKVARSAILKSDFCQDIMPVASSSHPINTQRFDSSPRNLVLVLSFQYLNQCWGM